MHNAFTIERSLFDLLVESQNPGSGLPFQMDSEAVLHNYNPGDLRVIPFLPQDGLYIFFTNTDFDPSMCQKGEQEHDPQLRAFLYVSKGATSTETSPDAAHAAAKRYMSSLYECLRHTETQRLLREKVQETIPGLRIPKLSVTNVKNVMTYPINEQASRTVMFWELMAEWRNTETPGQNPGVLITGVEDRVHVVREEGDL